MSKKNYWDLTNRPHTKLKLDIYKKYLDSWCRIFLNQKYYEEVYIVDCFAGRGKYIKQEKQIDGSPLIAVKAAVFGEDVLVDVPYYGAFLILGNIFIINLVK